MSGPRDEYLRATYELAQSSPAAWENFVIAFTHYTWYELERMLTAPTDAALISIGQGRRMRELRDDFRDIRAVGEKLKHADRR